MAYVSETGAVIRCFNSANLSRLIANCGFTVTRTVTCRYIVSFGFVVTDRFVITEEYGFNAAHFYGAG